eukprot:10958179-Ditylum_brightwellii.AAC.1
MMGSVYKIVDHYVKELAKLIIGSDSSDDKNSMVFGWEIVTYSREVLIKCMGPELDWKTFFRVEIYDLPSIQYPYDYSYNALDTVWDTISYVADILKVFDGK